MPVHFSIPNEFIEASCSSSDNTKCMRCVREKKKEKKKGEMWDKRWLLGRERFTHINLLNVIRNVIPEGYKNYLGMSDENVQNFLLQK